MPIPEKKLRRQIGLLQTSDRPVLPDQEFRSALILTDVNENSFEISEIPIEIRSEAERLLSKQINP